MFPVNPLFNMLPRDLGEEKRKGRLGKAMTEAEKALYPTKQELYQLCGEYDVPIVAMKPYAGGNVLKNHEEGRLKGLLSLTPVQCISYVLSYPQVACPVPGFKDVNELNQALAYLNANDAEKDFSEINDSIVANFNNNCMYCNHCQPCPGKINMAEVTKLADMAENGMTNELSDRYNALESKGGNCVQCGVCYERCPFGIDSVANIRRAKETFGC
jgi:predicted aldo/keto reductase-like oxidoreductase